MAVGPKKSVHIWTYSEASKALPYLRLVLRDLREGFVAIWNLYRVAWGDVKHPDFQNRIRLLGDEARTILEELDRLGVIPYQSPLRGIALFPFVVHEATGRRREAYFVYKDTRDEIDSYILQDDLGENGDLYADEKPVPAAWKVLGANPRLERKEGP